MEENKTNIPQDELNDEALDSVAGGGGRGKYNNVIEGYWFCTKCYRREQVKYNSAAEWNRNKKAGKECPKCGVAMKLKKEE